MNPLTTGTADNGKLRQVVLAPIACVGGILAIATGMNAWSAPTVVIYPLIFLPLIAASLAAICRPIRWLAALFIGILVACAGAFVLVLVAVSRI